MGYEYRVIAFIDILGFEKALDKSNSDYSEFDRILTTLTDLKEFFIRTKDSDDVETDKYLDADTHIIQISDSLIISRLLQEQGGIYNMLLDCSFAIHLLISNGFLCRGAIKYGKMYHRDTTIFGQAYLDAYFAEENERLPIIRFDKNLFDIVKHFPGPANKGFEDWEVNFIKQNCKQLNSDEYYLDYFTDYDSRVGGGEGTASMHYSKLREIIVNGLNDPELSCKPNALEKLRWAAEQFNLTANNFGLKMIK